MPKKEQAMLRVLSLLCAASLMMIGTVGCQSSPKTDSEKVQKQEEVRSMERETLSQLYAAQPSSRAVVQNAAGYAVFSNFGMKLFVTGGGHGEGVAVQKSPSKVVYMKMAELQAGLGFGVKKFRLVWVFDTAAAFDQFVNSGWEFGGQASAAAKTADQGSAMQGALSVAPGVWLYQLTDAGLALELTAKGTKYYRDDGLN
jgi:lipid-binding SYLF domain-containing protein